MADRLENYNFFSYMFLTLPNHAFVNKILGLNFEQISSNETGVEYIKRYAKSCAVRMLSEVLKDLLIDRTRLLRAVSEDGCPPPYESLYVKRPPQDVIGELTLLYNQARYCLIDDVHESREYIGVELNFMGMLCLKQLEALESNDICTAKDMELLQVQFFTEHLNLWISDFAEEMYKASKTEFYKGIALMLKDWIKKELVYLSGNRSFVNDFISQHAINL